MKSKQRARPKPLKTNSAAGKSPDFSAWELAWALPLLAGSATLAWHPWGLLLLGLSLGIFLAQRRPRGSAALPAPPAEIPSSWKSLVFPAACLAAALACGTWLYLFFCNNGILYDRSWYPVWGLTALCAVCLASAALSLPARVKAAKPDPAPPAQPLWRTLLFWESCLQTAVGLIFNPALGAAGFCVALYCAPPHRPGRPKPKTWFWPALALVGVLGLFLHVWQLRAIPQGINQEEGVTLETARTISEDHGQYFCLNWVTFSGVTLYHHLVGWFYRLFSDNDVAPLRSLSVAGWAVLALYSSLLSAEFFSLEAALGTAAYASLSFACIHYGRFGFYFIWAPAMAAAALYHAARALKSPRAALHFSCCGAWCALALYGWIAGFVIPALPLVYWLAVLGFDRKLWKPLVPGLACGLAAFLSLAAASIAAHLHFPGGLGSLFQGNSGLIGDQGNLSSNLLRQWGYLFSTGTSSATHYLPGLPLVDFSVLPFCAAGLAVLLTRPFSGRSLPLLAACFLGLLPAWISDPTGMNFGRLILLLFPLGVLFGLGWAALLEGLGDLPWKGLAAFAPALGLLLLAAGSGRGAWLYFHDYKSSWAAFSDNNGLSTVMAREFLEGHAPQEGLYYSENFDQNLSLMLLMPPGTNRQPWRDAPDVLRLLCTEPTMDRYLVTPVRVDWLPWLRTQEPGVEVKYIENPWGRSYSNNPMTSDVGPGDVAAIRLGWKAISPKAGLKRTGPGRWEGILWPPRTDDYVLSANSGSLLLAGKYRIEPGQQRSFFLAAVPYSVVVTGSPGDPGVRASIQRVYSEEWDQPLFHAIDAHGLRKTLCAADAKTGDPRLTSLVPVVSERFDTWSYEPFETLVVLPMRGDWEGSLRVPKSGRYLFTVPNKFQRDLELSLDGKPCFSTTDGIVDIEKGLDLRSGRAVSVHIHADYIPPASAMRFLVQGPDGTTRAVPQDWMTPAPLPEPKPSAETPAHAKP